MTNDVDDVLSHIDFGGIKKKFSESEVVRDAKGKFSKFKAAIDFEELKETWNELNPDDPINPEVDEDGKIILTDKDYEKLGYKKDKDGTYRELPTGSVSPTKIAEKALDSVVSATGNTKKKVKKAPGQVSHSDDRDEALAHIGFGGIIKKFSESEVVRDTKGKFSKIKGIPEDMKNDIEEFLLDKFGDGSKLSPREKDEMVKEMIENLQKGSSEQVGAPRKKDGQTFNPDAKLDNSQVSGEYKNKLEMWWASKSRADDQFRDKIDNRLDPVKLDPSKVDNSRRKKVLHSDIVDWALDALSHADEGQSVVIVAIPSEDDPVWKVSSEKVPHMTLMYLGKNGIQNEENVVQFVQHIAKNSMRRFGMSVDRRGTLGDDDADVLFFEKDWMTKNLVECRAHLLTNDDISTAYNAAEQYPDFTPHLTLGYPESPAKKPDNDFGLHWVNFDRIAIWFGDSEGPEFVLPHNEMMAEPVYHSELHAKRQKRIESQSELASMRAKARANREENGEELKHHGVQGMRWGYRRGVGPDGRVTGVAKKVGRVAASAGKKSAKFSSEQAVKRQQKSPKDSADHELLKAALTRDVSKFTTQEIKAVNARIKALGELENVRAENAAASRSKPRKLASWALENVAAGAKNASESYIQNLTGQLLKGALPDIGDLTGNSGKKKTEKPQEKAKDKVFDADKKSDKKASPAQPPAKSGPLIDGGDGKRTKKSGSSKERDDAIDDLVYTITNVKKKKGR